MTSKIFIHVAKLENNKYYVGHDIVKIATYPSTIEWLNINNFLELIETYESEDEFDGDKLTKKYMAKYGIENVRGGSYTNVVLEEWQIKSLQHELKNFINENNCISDVDTKLNYLKNFPTSKQIYWEKERITEIIKLARILNDNIETTMHLLNSNINGYDYVDHVINEKLPKNATQDQIVNIRLDNKKRFLLRIGFCEQLMTKPDDEINYLFDNLPEIMLIKSDMFNNHLLDIKHNVKHWINHVCQIFNCKLQKKLSNNISLLKQMQEKSDVDIYIEDGDGNIEITSDIDDDYHYFNDLVYINLNLLDEFELFPFTDTNNESNDNTNIQMLNIMISNIHLFRLQNEALLKKIIRNEGGTDFKSLINELSTKFNLLINKEIELVQKQLI